jgi:mRNA interferase MazF
MGNPSVTRGKIVLVPFPFDDLTGAKVRPAVCLRVSSTLRLHRLMTASTSLVVRELGELSAGLQTQVADRLRKLFALE